MNAARDSAYSAVFAFIRTHHTNAVANAHIWRAVNEALNAYEEHEALQYDTRDGYVVMLNNQPMLVVPTWWAARMQARHLRRMDQTKTGKWTVRRTQIAR